MYYYYLYAFKINCLVDMNHYKKSTINIELKIKFVFIEYMLLTVCINCTFKRREVFRKLQRRYSRIAANKDSQYMSYYN